MAEVFGKISQDFENAYRAVELLRATKELNTTLIGAALARVEELNSEGETKTAIVNLFRQWEGTMTAENDKLGVFADKANDVITRQEEEEGIRREVTERMAVSPASPTVPTVPTTT
ncbi:hypothetical protein [Streptomyces sp. NPDC056632]|uniref:hypothetical protein n=1 Tax=Streptomyces sp. NPDC056632 TaxID=3345884 RepID=UPI00368067B0